MKFVKNLVDFKHDHGTGSIQYHAGETVKVSEDDAKYFCDAGWCEDPSGELKTGKPDANVTLKPATAAHGVESPTLGAK